MKHCRLYLVSALLSVVSLFADGQVNYNSNTLTTQSGYYPSALGYTNTANGKYSLVGGINSKANGECSFGFGDTTYATGKNSFAFGYQSEATSDYSLALGYLAKANGQSAIAIGADVQVLTVQSIGIGRNLRSTASGGYIIGMGCGLSQPMVNNIAHSLMVGFNSTLPTFFVGDSPGSTLTGKVGIGNITDPTAKLHVLADENEASELKLEHRTSGLRQYSQIYLGTHTIRAGNAENMVFTTPAGRNFAFQTGNVGVGTTAPTQKLDVDGNIRLRSNGAIGSWSDNALNFTTNGITRMTLLSNGNFGIGTADPGSKFQVTGGDVFVEDINSGIIMKSPDGRCWRGTMTNEGAMAFAETPCPSGSGYTAQPAEPEASDIRIYPNPSGGRFTIESSRLLNNGLVNIFTADGRLIQEISLSGSTELQAGNFTPGVYIISVTENGRLLKSQQVVVK